VAPRTIGLGAVDVGRHEQVTSGNSTVRRGPPSAVHAHSLDMRIDELAARTAEAASLCSVGRYQDAIVPYEEALAACEATFGTDHLATLTVAGNLGVAYVAGGRQRQGIRLLAFNLADRERILGYEDLRTLTARDALAVAHRLAGNVDDALALSTQVTAQRRRRLGPTHPATLTSRMGLALAMEAAADVERAVTLLTAAINDARQAYGPKHLHTTALLECRGALMMDPGPGPTTQVDWWCPASMEIHAC
jgi:hypothetical protein